MPTTLNDVMPTTMVDGPLSVSSDRGDEGDWRPQRVVRYSSVEGNTLCLEKVEEDAMRYAAQAGLNLDALLEGAAAHFLSDEIRPLNTELSSAELDLLIEDDLRTFDAD